MKQLLTIAFLVFSMTAFSQTLKEKQALANVSLESAEKTLKEATGKDIKIEIDTKSFSGDMDAIDYLQSRATKVANGISKLCYNDIGKNAFNGKKITKIKLVNLSTGKKSIVIANGVLIVTNNTSSENYQEDEIKDVIENML
ncbi:hypothetical protein WSM22_04880 [Cytophagales bacterium WSM2-2]|nr:hypothetical protein WSM22_04880 [Cytophagales bacterium WSM2-2]